MENWFLFLMLLEGMLGSYLELLIGMITNFPSILRAQHRQFARALFFTRMTPQLMNLDWCGTDPLQPTVSEKVTINFRDNSLWNG